MLHEQLRRHFPCLFRGGVGIVRAVELQYAAVGEHTLCLRRVDERAVHVDISIQDVVLRILVRAVHAFLREQYRHFRSGQTTDVGMKIYRPANFILDGIQCLARRAQLFARYRNTSNAFRGSFNQTVEM